MAESTILEDIEPDNIEKQYHCFKAKYLEKHQDDRTEASFKQTKEF